MKVQRDIELGNRLPEDIPFGLVVEDPLLRFLSMTLRIVDQRAFEAVLNDASLQLFRSLFRIMHRQSSADSQQNVSRSRRFRLVHTQKPQSVLSYP